ncbi:MAG: DNA-processing protein DprA [Clostridia bacterium]|nr:DNA-processing protein DprA [Clostridia bacterium]
MTYTEEEQNLIILSSIDELKSKEKLSAVKAEDLIKTAPSGVYNIVKHKFYDKAYRAEVLENLHKKGIVCVTYLSPDYPENLKHIDEPPAVLYCKGNLDLLKTNCFSVVGSRKSTATAIAQCKKICGEITEAFTVVTGMAEGADSAAVEGALPSGKIISVLANGFDYFYPAVNRGLIEKVANDGLLISEYPPHIPPLKYNFPVRNRIIAGLSRGTLVVSAAKKSGALITARYALEYGREVFAFPYNAGITSGAGCNGLIKNGAYLTENILDIFEVFGLDLEKPKALPALSDIEKAVLEQIKISGEGFLPAIARNLETFTYQLIPVVTKLEIMGLITRLGGNRYGIV